MIPLALLFLLALAAPDHRRPPVVGPADGVPRPELRSEPYYAVILKSGPACSLGAREIARAQALFPTREVFSTDFECAPERNETFTGVAPEHDFLALFAGRDRATAERVLHDAKRRFPDANLRRLQTVEVAP